MKSKNSERWVESLPLGTNGGQMSADQAQQTKMDIELHHFEECTCRMTACPYSTRREATCMQVPENILALDHMDSTWLCSLITLYCNLITVEGFR